jgi:rRNA maturation endonuclease Nob1
MAFEALAGLLVGVAALWLVLHPLLRPSTSTAEPFEPLDPEETPKGVALAALKEIEFDRETGKLSDGDYDFLKAKYTEAALQALRAEQPVVASDDLEAMIAAKVRSLRSSSATASSDPAILSCVTCGPRPEADAVFCSNCGRRLPTDHTCARCSAALQPDSKFCESCGRPVAA